MKFDHETRRKIYFDIPETIAFQKEYIEAGDGELAFNKKDKDGNLIFDTVEKCEKWIEENLKDMPPSFKAFHEIEFKSFKVTDTEWEKIKGQMVNPDEFTQDDIKVYHPMLAHNYVDRDGERFPRKVIEKFNQTIPGKSVLIGHQWGPPGVGRFFDSKIEKLTVGEAADRCRQHPDKNFMAHLQKISEMDGGIFYLCPAFYVLKDNTDFVRNLDAGIIKDMSIGFRTGPRVPVKADEAGGGGILWHEYTADDNTEAMEGSFVWLGSQYSASNRKQVNDPAPNKGDENKDNQQPVENAGSADEPTQDSVKNIKRKEIMMQIKMDTIGFEKEFELNEETFAPIIQEIETAFKAKNDEAEKVKTELDGIKKDLDGKTVTELKSLADVGKQLRDELIAETVKMGALAGLVEKDKVDAEKTLLESLTIDQIKYKLDQYVKAFDVKNPRKGILPEAKINETMMDKPSRNAYREPIR